MNIRIDTLIFSKIFFLQFTIKTIVIYFVDPKKIISLYRQGNYLFYVLGNIEIFDILTFLKLQNSESEKLIIKR